MFLQNRINLILKRFLRTYQQEKKIISPLINNYKYSTDQKKIIPFKLSDIGEGISEVILKEWYVKANDYVHEFDNICEVQSDKASVTISSRYQGTIVKLNYAIDDVIKVGSNLLDIQVDHWETKNILNIQKFNNLETQQKILATPIVRNLIKNNKININDITVTGKDKRILKEDVINIIKKQESNNELNDVKIQPLSNIQKVMAKKMTEALKVPHFVYSDEINVTKLIEVRNEISSHIKEVEFTFMPLFIKALSNALISYPILNSIIDDNCENILYKSAHNIGIATDTKAGLVVPVIKNVQNKSLFQIAETLMDFNKKKLTNSWTQDDLSDGTITLSNIGSIGGTYMKPIILPPQVIIGALGRIYSHEINNQKLINISWAADHRILDGGTISRFSNLWKKQLENPILLLTNYYTEYK